MQIKDVVAALIWDGDRFMICKRPPTKARGLLWEFVGGKVEPGETHGEALIRECREELAVTVCVGTPFTRVVHEYPDLTIRLCLYRCTIGEGTPRLLEHVDLKWITPEEIPQYDFCPADETVLKMIVLEYRLRKELEKAAEPDFQRFQARLLPTLPPSEVLGVKTPALRRIARRLRGDPEGRYYSDILTHNSLEEAQLHSFYINEETDYRTALRQTEAFLPSVNNWAVCDQLSPKGFFHQPALREACRNWLQSDAPYTVRFGIDMLMKHFSDGDFDAGDLTAVSAVRSGDYYVNMAVAWYFATVLAKQEAAALPFFRPGVLPEQTRKTAVRKACESRRVSGELKQILKNLR